MRNLPARGDHLAQQIVRDMRIIAELKLQNYALFTIAAAVMHVAGWPVWIMVGVAAAIFVESRRDDRHIDKTYQILVEQFADLQWPEERARARPSE